MTNHETDTSIESTPRRRTILTGAAWTIPAVAVAVAAPMAAASVPPCVPQPVGSVTSRRTSFTTPLRTGYISGVLANYYYAGTRVQANYTLTNNGTTTLPAGVVNYNIFIGSNPTKWGSPQISLPAGFSLVRTETTTPNLSVNYVMTSSRPILPGESFDFQISAIVPGTPSQGAVRLEAQIAQSGTQCDGSSYFTSANNYVNDSFIAEP